MKRLRTNEPVWDLSFDEKGRLTELGQDDLIEGIIAEGVDDLFVFSHGWGTSEASARRMYDDMFPMIRAAAQGMPGIATTGFVGIYWPSLWFPPTPATSATSADSIQSDGGAVVDLTAGTASLSGAEIAESLRSGFADEAQRNTVTEIGRLIDEGEAADRSGATDAEKELRLRQIHDCLRSLAPASLLAETAEPEDTGETLLLTAEDPTTAFLAAADAFGSAPPGGDEASLGDWFRTALNGAKDAARVLSYTLMKGRAGDIGRDGLGPMLAVLKARSPNVRVHLIGHSFGARLVSFALAGVGSPAKSPVASLLLIQAAFSHWSFSHAGDNPFGRAGALHTVADRVHGPLVATFSVFDWAVGVWYPRASFLSRQDTEAEVAGRWGGLGSDGFKAVSPFESRTMLASGEVSSDFAPGTFYGVDAADVINDTEGQAFAGAHSDIRKPGVAKLVVAVAASR